MTTANDGTYFIVRDKDGNEYLCPLNQGGDRATITEDEMEDCVEKDIAERYSGNINIKPC